MAGRSDSKKNSLLNNLATLTGDRTELRNQTLSILVAGRDTTAALLGWCFVRLALHPEVFSKLRGVSRLLLVCTIPSQWRSLEPMLLRCHSYNIVYQNESCRLAR